MPKKDSTRLEEVSSDEPLQELGPDSQKGLIEQPAHNRFNDRRERMKVIGFELEDWEREVFDMIRDEHDLLLMSEPLNRQVGQDLLDAEAISTFVYSDLSARSLQQFRNLKLVATRSTGFDHIDIEYCKKHDITVCNVPAYADETVAEHVFALLLAISHNIVKAVEKTRTGSFSRKGLQGFDLHGKTMGVIGTGNIGKSVIRIARGFYMNVLAFDVKPDNQAASSLGFSYVDMNELLSSADILTLHVPGGAKTRHLISESEFSKMKDGSVLINTARGDVVDIRALLKALANNKIAAAGLDVLPEEPAIREEAELLRSIFAEQHDVQTLFAEHMLTHQPNVLVTPHNAFNTREAMERLLDTSVQNIVSFAKGECQNVVA